MRLLEAIGTAGFVLYAGHLLYWSSDWEGYFALLLYVSTLIIVCHAWLEGCRWQMTPTYFLAIGFALHECAHLLWGSNISAPVGLIALALALASIFLCTVMPVFKLPAPTGPYKLGTQTRHIIDHSRHDPLLGGSDVGRELVIQIWYPADPLLLSQKSAPYRDRGITSVKDAHLALVKTHSMLGARLLPSKAQFPVLLYTPSWSGIRTECTTMAEELASHGYVVVGIDHPYSSRIMIFPDGRIARRKFLGDEDYSSEAAVDAFVKTADQQVEIRAQDVSFVLDTLEYLNGNDPNGLLTGSLDIARVGIFGFSLGGGTAAQACWLDRRFRAGLDMGGMIAGESAKQGTFVPFFFMFEGMYESFPYALGSDISNVTLRKRRDIEFTRKQFEQMKRLLSEHGGYWLTINGIRHMDFSDSPFFSPLRRGPVKPERIARIISRYSLAFFDKHLRETEQPLLDGPSLEVSELGFQVWMGRAT
ncbi:alpha/beta hydrolase family protein [Bradyrhizobium sp. McL0616]|uniref:alpha/beta hydrolase family protein n=1 Tax=Bradyrhizobium sp. McL0616 TaxID=3415674 RepID=UPI003CEBFF6E